MGFLKFKIFTLYKLLKNQPMKISFPTRVLAILFQDLMIRLRWRGASRFGFIVLRWLIEAAEDQRRPGKCCV